MRRHSLSNHILFGSYGCDPTDPKSGKLWLQIWKVMAQAFPDRTSEIVMDFETV